MCKVKLTNDNSRLREQENYLPETSRKISPEKIFPPVKLPLEYYSIGKLIPGKFPLKTAHRSTPCPYKPSKAISKKTAHVGDCLLKGKLIENSASNHFFHTLPKKLSPGRKVPERCPYGSLPSKKLTLWKTVPENLPIRPSKELLHKIYFWILIPSRISSKQKLNLTYRKKWSCQRCWVLIFFLFNYFLLWNIFVKMSRWKQFSTLCYFLILLTKNYRLNHGVIIPSYLVIASQLKIFHIWREDKIVRFFFYPILLTHKQLLNIIQHFTFTISNSGWKRGSLIWI